MLLSQGKIAEALAAVQPVIDAANKTVAPSAADARAYASAFLVYGQILEAQKKYPEALEAYLTVKTMFYQNPALVDQSDASGAEFTRAQAARQCKLAALVVFADRPNFYVLLRFSSCSSRRASWASFS